jgi:hypothetical protein
MPSRTPLCLLIALTVGACTGNPSEQARPETTPASGSSGYVERWNAGCSGMPGEVAEIVAEAFGQQTPGAAPAPDVLRAAAERVAAAVRRRLDAIRALPAPAEDRPLVDGLLGAFDAGLAAVLQRPGSLESIGTGLPDDPFAVADRLAIGYGAGRCALSSADQGGD